MPALDVPDTPPFVVIEILSKDDRYAEVIQKLDEYREWGVPNIWLIDPITKHLSVHTDLGPQNVAALTLHMMFMMFIMRMPVPFYKYGA